MRKIIFLYGIIFSLLLAGCQPSVKSHAEGEGPLSVRVGTGGLSMIFEDLETPWYGTVGAFLPCLATGKKQLEITKVGYVEYNLAKPVDVRVMKRVVEGNEIQDLIGASRGVPPELESSHLSGDISEDYVGTLVTESCDEPVDFSNFTEFLFVIESDETGMHIEEVFFEYNVGGRPYVLEVPWEIMFCGEATKEHWMCSESE
jgi:hypothetical protein